MTHNKTRNAFWGALMSGAALVSLLAVPAVSQAQESVLLEEIVVTAQKREQNQQDVGIAITALSGNQMRALGYTNAQEVTALAPGVSTLQPNGEANYAIGMRGVANNDFTTNIESPIAIYVDEVYISQMSGAGFMLFDMERVEILRGPQGTLFGRNATGGLVQYVTVKPSEEFNGYGSISYGRFNRVKFQGAVGVPISDSISARVSVATHQGDGYVTNRLKPGSKLNNANDFAIRAQLLFLPSENLDVLLNVRYGAQDIRTGFFEYVSALNAGGVLTPGQPNPDLGGYVDNDGDIYAGDYDFEGHNDLKTEGYSATINWSNDSITVTSITDYQTTLRDYIEDSDASPFNYFNFFLTTDAKQFSQELRVSGGTDQLKWVGGLYYLDLEVNDTNGGIMPGLFEGLFPLLLGIPSLDVEDIDEVLFGAPPDPRGLNGIYNPYRTTSKSWSLFGQGEYQVSDTLTLVGGFRWIKEKKTHVYDDFFGWYLDTAVSGLDVDQSYLFSGIGFQYQANRNDSEWAARAQVNYQPNDDMLFYASWNRGVKSGGFNAPLLPTPQFVTDPLMNYRPETLDAYEVGFKVDLAEGRARINGSAYYYDYKDCQVFSILGLDTFTLNGDCKSKGFELEFIGAPADGLDIQFGIGFIDAEVKDVPGVTIDAQTDLGPIPAIIPGATVTPVQTPKWNLNGLVRYEFPLSSGSIALQGDFQYRSEHFFTLIGTEASTENGYTVFNTSVAYIPEDGNWDLRFAVHNVGGEKYLVQTFDLSGNLSNPDPALFGLFGMVEQYYGRPRTWTVTLNYSF